MAVTVNSLLPAHRGRTGDSSATDGISTSMSAALIVVANAAGVEYVPVTWHRNGNTNTTIMQSAPGSSACAVAGTCFLPNAATNPDAAIQATIPWETEGSVAGGAKHEVPMHYNVLRLTFAGPCTLVIMGCP